MGQWCVSDASDATRANRGCKAQGKSPDAFLPMGLALMRTFAGVLFAADVRAALLAALLTSALLDAWRARQGFGGFAVGFGNDFVAHDDFRKNDCLAEKRLMIPDSLRGECLRMRQMWAGSDGRRGEGVWFFASVCPSCR